MFICPTCQKEYEIEEVMVKHMLACWKEHFPNYKSKSAPVSDSITTREVDEGVLNFFDSFHARNKN